MEETNRLIQEIVKTQSSLIGIDTCDIEDTFTGSSPIHGFTVAVDSALDSRAEVLMGEVRGKAEQYKPFIHALVFFFFPTDKPLLMEELKPLSDWIETFPSEFMIKWGMATHPKQELRTIVIIK
ncbi:MAG: hypothetical protein K6A32_09720 [Bacteroidales bacterium]|nr:hypothetical protein [Bacteroidales bacterium]